MRSIGKRKKAQMDVFVLLAPVVIVFVAFTIVPFVISLIISFFRYTGYGKMEFVGLNNYIITLTGDANFTRSTIATLLIFLVSVVPQNLIALMLALILNNKFIKLKGLFRAVFFMPYITSGISLAIVFMGIFSVKEIYGIANYMASLFGLEPVNWFANPA